MWEFDSQSGSCLVDDRMGVPVYSVKVEGTSVLVDLPE
jgi:nitrite reductase/ring-hydroxylating ferredoxin subunit